jgi:hypothetical protein
MEAMRRNKILVKTPKVMRRARSGWEDNIRLILEKESGSG